MSANRTDQDVLRESGLPVFFELPNAASAGFTPPENHRGQSVRVYARSLSGMQKEAVVVSAMTGRAWRLASDEGPYLNGFDAAPCPLSFLTTGLVCSYMNEILALAKQEGVAIRKLALTQDNYYTMRGSALRGTMTGGALPVELEIEIDAEASDADIERLIARAVANAPLQPLLTGEHHSLFSATLNGQVIALGRVRAIERGAEPDPASRVQWPQSLASGVSERRLIERIDPVDPNNAGPGGAGTSLQADQDRRLHVRGVCRLREDGVKEVQQHLFSPRGSVFRYLCDEAEGFGGAGRAPDAASYMAAGIAFCFMTQLGRYAHIVKRRLDEYSVIQDVHFARGGAGASGPIEPVETHVYLTSPEAEDFARTVIDMGEQTCFLHAFCRTPLETKVRIAAHR